MMTRLVAKALVVTQELLSPQMVMAQFQFLGVGAMWLKNGDGFLLVEGGFWPDSLPTSRPVLCQRGRRQHEIRGALHIVALAAIPPREF